MKKIFTILALCCTCVMPISAKTYKPKILDIEATRNWATYQIMNAVYEIDFTIHIHEMQDKDLSDDDVYYIIIKQGEIIGYENLLHFLEDYQREYDND